MQTKAKLNNPNATDPSSEIHAGPVQAAEFAGPKPNLEPATVMCPVSKLKPHPLNAAIYGDSYDAALLQSIQEHGILKDLCCLEDWTVVDGNRRLAGAIEAGIKEVPVKIVAAKGDAALELLLEFNLMREKSTEVEVREYRQYKKLETAKAKERRGKRSDLRTNLSAGDAGRAREIAAAKVGMSGTSAEDGLKILEAIAKHPDHPSAQAVRDALAHNIAGAKKLAQREGLLAGPKPSNRKAQSVSAARNDTSDGSGSSIPTAVAPVLEPETNAVPERQTVPDPIRLDGAVVAFTEASTIVGPEPWAVGVTAPADPADPSCDKTTDTPACPNLNQPMERELDGTVASSPEPTTSGPETALTAQGDVIACSDGTEVVLPIGLITASRLRTKQKQLTNYLPRENPIKAQQLHNLEQYTCRLAARVNELVADDEDARPLIVGALNALKHVLES